MTLLQRQREFRDYLRDQPSTIATQIAGDARARLAIYHHAFRARLDDCLRDTYAKTWGYLGDDGFASAIEQHRHLHEPSSWTLDAYGQGFDATLTTLYPEDAEVAELAWLEWALRRAFDGPDAAPLMPEALAEMDWDNAVPLLHPTLQWHEVVTNAAAIWAAINAEAAPPPAQPLSEPTLLLVWRKELTPQYRSISGHERLALLAVASGERFGAMCERVFADVPAEQAVPMIGTLLGRWVSDGLIIGTRA